MELSKYNILTPVADSEDYIIVNPLYGHADILNKATAESILAVMESQANERSAENLPNTAELSEKGYLVDPGEEKKTYRKAYLDFIDDRDSGEVQIFFVPWYDCNFNCSYCYQESYDNTKSPLKKETTDAFFKYVESRFAGRRRYITLFGGEPLLGGGPRQEAIEYFLQRCAASGVDLAIVTNGYHMSDYMPLIQKSGVNIREIQLTLDGPEETHNARRPLKGGKGTFSEVVDAIDLVLSHNLSVNLRIVVDRENFTGLLDVAHMAIEKGWTKNRLFKTQLGRNYELHSCQKGSSKLFDRANMYSELLQLINEHPEFMEFHRPAYSITRFLYDNGELPEPLFDSCPGCKTEWAFDYTGSVYSCTATVGKESEKLGTFYPEIVLNSERIEEWQDRDVTAIEKCRSCPDQLACGAGCAAVAMNTNGSLHSPDCRPVSSLIGMGASLYFGE